MIPSDPPPPDKSNVLIFPVKGNKKPPEPVRAPEAVSATVRLEQELVYRTSKLVESITDLNSRVRYLERVLSLALEELRTSRFSE